MKSDTVLKFCIEIIVKDATATPVSSAYTQQQKQLCFILNYKTETFIDITVQHGISAGTYRALWTGSTHDLPETEGYRHVQTAMTRR